MRKTIKFSPQSMVLATVMLTLNLSALGQTRDPELILNLEVDYMYSATHTHLPLQSDWDALVDVFASEGITLNVVIDDALTHIDNLAAGEDRIIAQANFDHFGVPTWRHCLLVHNSGSGSNYYGFGFAVANSEGRALIGVIMHELGHSLGLSHGVNNAPNYPSVMNYRYSKGDIVARMSCDELATACPAPFKMLDYSHGNLPTLDELALVEQDGMGLGPVDWNCNGIIETLPYVKNLRGGSRCTIISSAPWSGVADNDDWQTVKNTLGEMKSGKAVATWEGSCEGLESTSEEKSPPPNSTVYSCLTFFGTFTGQSGDSLIGRDIDGDGIYDFCDPCPYQATGPCCCTVPGDANRNGSVDLGDYQDIINYIFGQGGLTCMDAGDADGNNYITVSDVVRIINYIMSNSTPPVCGTRGF